MSKLLKLSFVLKALIIPATFFFADALPSLAWINPGFETGDLTGWTSSTNVGGNVVCVPSAAVVTNGVAPDSNGPSAPAGLNMVHSGNYALQLFSGRGDNNHVDWARIEQTDNIPVDGNCCLSFWFAGVFEDHHYLQNNLTGDTFLLAEIIIGGATVASVRYTWSNNVGQIVVDGLTGNGNGPCDVNGTPNDFGFLPWTDYTINLCQYAGQQVTLRVTDHDCDAGGHFGYGYLDDVSWVSCPTPKITLTKANSPTGQVSQGATITYTLSYANTGTSPIDGVVISDNIPTGTTLVPGSIGSNPNIPDTTQVGSNIIWTIGYLYPGNSGTLTFQVTADHCGETIVNIAKESDLETPGLTSNAVTNTVVPCTPTPTNTGIPTNTPTRTNTAANTFTATRTFTSTATFSFTPTNSSTVTRTFTFTATSTATPTSTSTAVHTATFTFSPTNTSTTTRTFTSTATSTSTKSFTPIFTSTASFTSTSSFTPTRTYTSTATATATRTFSATFSPTVTYTPTVTSTATNTLSPTETSTATRSFTSTQTLTRTFTPTATQTFTSTHTSTSSFTPTWTYTSTNSFTPTKTLTPTWTFTATNTPTPTWTPTSTYTPTNTFTPTPGISLQKSASETSAKMGDTVTYNLTLVVTGSTASNIQVTDNLPAHMTFAGFDTPSAPPQAMTANGSALNWSFTTLAPGVYSLPYRVTVDTGLLEGGILVNSAQASLAGGVPQTVTASVTLAAPYTIKIGVYNSAGELVKILLVNSFFQPVGSFSLSSTTLTNSNGVITVSIAGQAVATWDGTSNAGVPLSNGNYFVKLDSVDPNGSVTSVTQDVILNRALYTLTVNVFNEVGEVVKHLYEKVVDIAGNSVKSMQLSASAIQPGAPTDSNIPSSTAIQVALPSGTVTLAWDGTNDVGKVVTNGKYFVEAHWVSNGDQVLTQSVAVVNGASDPRDGKVTAQPNILGPGQFTTLLTAHSDRSLTLKTRLYDVAGELVRTDEGPSGADQMTLDLSGLASGFYIVEADLMDGSAFVARQTLHLLIKH